MSQENSGAPRRARNVDELREVMSRFSTPEAAARVRAFVPRPTDVFVATYPKCGTTLMQQIVHGLRTRGDMDFEDISGVVPWIELAHDMGIDPEAEQRAEPRAFKTHLDWEGLPKGGRSIYLLRDPLAALVSFYHFFSGWFFEPGAIDLETFALDYVWHREGPRDYWLHLVSWWPHRGDADLLYLLYEDVVADLPGTVRRVADFMALEADEALIALATEQASLPFMRAHPAPWEDRLLRRARNGPMGLPVDVGSSKVREGSTAGRDEVVGLRIRSAWDERWRRVVEPVTGCADYAALREAVRAERAGAGDPSGAGSG